MSDSCCHKEPQKKNQRSWFLRPVLITVYAAAVLCLLSPFWEPLAVFRESFLHYVDMLWLPVLLGFFLGGCIDYYIPREYISKYLARPSRKTILYAAGLGFLMSACNHGILALSMALHRKGASGPAVVAFLLASPWANLPMTFILFSFFGWKALVIILSALVVAVVTGLVFLVLDSKGWIEKNTHSVKVDTEFSIRRDIVRRWHNRHQGAAFSHQLRGILHGMLMLADMVLMWILIGVILAGLAAAFVPGHVFHQYLGASLAGLIGTLLVATVLEVCSEGTAPLAFEIYAQTGAFGNAFAFLMAGVVTDYTEIGMLWKNLGRRTALWMVAVSLPQVIGLAWLFNHLF